MHIEMYYEGNKFVGREVGAEVTEQGAKGFVEFMRKACEGGVTYYTFDLKEGGSLMISGEVFKKAVFVLKGFPE